MTEIKTRDARRRVAGEATDDVIARLPRKVFDIVRRILGGGYDIRQLAEIAGEGYRRATWLRHARCGDEDPWQRSSTRKALLEGRDASPPESSSECSKPRASLVRRALRPRELVTPESIRGGESATRAAEPLRRLIFPFGSGTAGWQRRIRRAPTISATAISGSRDGETVRASGYASSESASCAASSSPRNLFVTSPLSLSRGGGNIRW